MREGCIKIGILVVALALAIYLVKNSEEILKLLNSKIKNKKIIDKIIYITIIFAIILCSVFFIKNCVTFAKLNNISEQNNQIFKEADLKIKNENDIYINLINQNYENQKYDEPYILEGFSYVEGNWQNGYVIQDELGNQYVWIPCTNKTVTECEKLRRTNQSAVPFINYISCYNESYEEFIKSALENDGFYISRYELGKENDKAVSKANVELLTNITKLEAEEIVSNMYNNVNCELINGYAYDTALKWIESSSSIRLNRDVVKVEKDKKIFSGRKMNNNIYDFCDNILEYSLENLYDTIVVRGFMDSDSTLYTNNIFSRESRYCMSIEDTAFGGITPVAIRTILYK